MEEKQTPKISQPVKDRFFNLIMDHGVSLTLSVAFCFAVYYIVHEQNTKLTEAIYELRKDRKELIQLLVEEQKQCQRDLIDCYKSKKQ